MFCNAQMDGYKLYIHLKLTFHYCALLPIDVFISIFQHIYNYRLDLGITLPQKSDYSNQLLSKTYPPH